MTFIFIPNEGTDSIKFGMKPEEISKILEQECEGHANLRSEYSEAYEEWGLYIFYKKDEAGDWICCRILFKPEKTSLIFQKKELLSIDLIELVDFLLQFDKDIETETDFIRFHGIGVLLGGQGLEIESNYDFPPDYIGIEKVD
jgi:hypothetical protein